MSNDETIDGYHTFKELYEFRKLYNAALFNEWSNIDHKYRRVLSDYTSLCSSCHKKYDAEKFGHYKKKDPKKYAEKVCLACGVKFLIYKSKLIYKNAGSYCSSKCSYSRYNIVRKQESKLT